MTPSTQSKSPPQTCTTVFSSARTEANMLMCGDDTVIQASYFKALIPSRCFMIIKRVRVKGSEQCWTVMKAKTCLAWLLFIILFVELLNTTHEPPPMQMIMHLALLLKNNFACIHAQLLISFDQVQEAKQAKYLLHINVQNCLHPILFLNSIVSSLAKSKKHSTVCLHTCKDFTILSTKVKQKQG